MRLRAICGALCVSTLAGCGPFPVVNTTMHDDGEILLVGAESRVITKHPVSSSNLGVVMPRTSISCSEPSPDIAKATEQAIGLALGIAGQGDGSLSYSNAEAIASLVERTATIQLLRDYMFRACEAVGNGMMTSTSYALLMSRTNKAMVTLMLGETAAGAFGRSGAAIGGKTSSNASNRMTGFAESFEEALENLRSVDEKLKLAQAELAAAQSALAAHDAKEEKNPDARNALEVAETEAAGRVSSLEIDKANAMALIQSTQTKTSEAAAEVAKVEGVGALTPSAKADVAKVLGDMQERYLFTGLRDEYVSACITDMGMRRNQETEEVPASESYIRSLNLKDGAPRPATMQIYKGETLLTAHCRKYMDEHLNQADANRAAHMRRTHESELAARQVQILSACMELDTKEAKSACLVWAGMKLPEKKDPPKKEESAKKPDPPKKSEKLLDLDAYVAMKALYEALTGSQADALVAANKQLQAADMSKADEALRKAKVALAGKVTVTQAASTNTLAGKDNPVLKAPAAQLITDMDAYIVEATVVLRSQASETDLARLKVRYDYLQVRFEEFTPLLKARHDEHKALVNEIESFLKGLEAEGQRETERVRIELQGTVERPLRP